MRLPRDEAAALRQIEDEAIAANRVGGRVNHVSAAVHRRDELARLEAGGVAWAAGVRDDAEIAGHLKGIKARMKARKASLPTGRGDETVIVPAAYSHRDAKGHVQLTLWWSLPLDDLADLIADLEAQAATLTERGLVMRYGLDLARRHGVPTAAEAFAIEGIDISDMRVAA
jgi:hypothetical protein